MNSWRRLRANLDAQAQPQPWAVDRASVLRLLGLALVAALAALIAFGAGGYHAGFAALNDIGRSWPPMLLQSLTFLGDSLSVLAGLLIFGAARREVLWTGFIAALVGTLLSHLPKNLFAAARPPAVIDAAQLFVTGPAFTSHSFPSGHTVSIFVGAGMFAYFARTWPGRLLPLLVAALVGASRVMAGVHWPVDVLAGAAIGLCSVALAAPLAVRTQRACGAHVQVALALLLGGCAVALLVHRPDYALARAESVAVGLAALAVLAWRYFTAARTDRAPSSKC